MKRVLVFGSFDPLHEGHIHFFAQAKAQGDYLTVVIAHDEALRAYKGHDPSEPASERLRAVARLPVVDAALVGNKQARRYDLLSELDFEIMALGYDQEPSDEVVREELDKRGKGQAKIVRLMPYQPEKFKSSLLRNDT